MSTSAKIAVGAAAVMLVPVLLAAAAGSVISRPAAPGWCTATAR